MKGHLEKRYKSSWTIVIDLGRDPVTGKQKRIYRSVKGNKKQAEQEMQRLMAELQQGVYVSPTKITLAEYLNQWLQLACEPRLAANTVKSYRLCCERHIIPRMGQLYLPDIEPRHVQALYSSMLEDGVGKRTIELTHVTLHAALKQAVRWQILARNPVDAVEPPKTDRRELTTLEPDQISVLLKAAQGSPIEDLVFLALSTGMRKGELLALKWSDVDFGSGIIRVQRNLVRVNGKTVLKSPKTRAGQRAIPLDPVALARLVRLRSQSRSEFVFSRRDGQPMDPSTVTHQFSRIAKAAGFPGLRFHDLRHAHATTLLAQGINPKVVQERLGHSTITTTLDIYSHVTPTMQREAANAFLRALTEVERRFSDGQPSDSREVQ